MGRRTLFVVYLLIAIFVSAQNLLANTKKQDNCLNEKYNTTNKKSAPTTKKNTANNLITNLKTHSNSKLLKEASAYISQKNNIDSALICYSIVYKRYADAKETINDTTLTKTLSGLWYIYFFHYYDYIKANEILKESLNVCKERNLNSSWVYLDFGFMYQMIAEQSSEKSLYNKALSHYKVAYYGARRHNDWAVMLDAFGNMSNNKPLRKKELKNLRERGIEIYEFDPIRFPWVNHVFARDHRKIVVIDGSIAYTGGMNVADYYINGTKVVGEWHDMHCRIEGDEVNTLQKIFIKAWNKVTKQHLSGAKYYRGDHPNTTFVGLKSPFG